MIALLGNIVSISHLYSSFYDMLGEHQFFILILLKAEK